MSQQLYHALPGWLAAVPGWLAAVPRWFAVVPGWLAAVPRWFAAVPGWLAASTPTRHKSSAKPAQLRWQLATQEQWSRHRSNYPVLECLMS